MDLGGPAESWTPGEGGGVSEQLSEEAKERFAANAAAMKQIRTEEKQSKKGDDQVAQVIIQFLGDKRYSHLFVLISRLVARNCPSIFILSILSLIHDESHDEVGKYLSANGMKTDEEVTSESMALMKTGDLDPQTNGSLVAWITRMQMILTIQSQQVLPRLMIDEKNLDGTILQLTTFVVQEFFKQQKRSLPFEEIQPLTASILHLVLEPFLADAKRAYLEAVESDQSESDD